MQQFPLVSVLITSYNREQYIAEAIQSVLSQVYKNFELIIVDDCSSDRTVEIIKSYEHIDTRIKVFVNENNLGQFANRNLAASYATGKYIKYVDSDDIIYPSTLKYMVDAMENHPEVGMGFCLLLNDDNKIFPYVFESKKAIRDHYLEGKTLFVGPSGCIYSKKAFNEVGMFEEYGMPSDSHLNLKIICKYPTIAFPKDLFLWREHDDQTFQKNKNNYYNIIKNYDYSIDIIDNYSPLSNKENKTIKYHLRKNFIKHLMRIIFLKRKPKIALSLIKGLISK
jgi:glycosyltransferase involved in cell wall biosynthesis